MRLAKGEDSLTSLRVLFQNGTFTIPRASVAPSEKQLVKDAGFQFDSVNGVWFCETPQAAARLRDHCSATAKKIIDRVMLKHSPWLGPLSYPKGLKLREFQSKIAIPFILSTNKTYLAADPGLGKTICAAIVSNATREPVIYICPPFLTLTVLDEFRKWINWTKKISVYEESASELPDILIVSDTLIHKPEVRAVIENQSAYARLLGCGGRLFVDEAHRFRNPKTRRTRAIFGDPPIRDRKNSPRDRGRVENAAPFTFSKSRGILDLFANQTYLSGTPNPNGRPVEMYTVLSKVAPETIGFMNPVQYGLRYCGGKRISETCPLCKGLGYRGKGVFCHYCKGQGKFSNGYDFSGASNLKELRRNVRDKFMLRLKKSDVLKELPPKTEEIILLGKTPPRVLKLESELRKASPKDLMQEKFGSPHLATYCRLLGEYKVRPAVEFINGVLEDTDESVLVFAFHKNVIAGLQNKLAKYKPLVITGLTSKEERHGIVKTFQSGKGSRLIIGNYLACGLGLTLTRATRVIFVEQSWVPAENDQASDRAHRIGQRDNVLVQYLVYEHSIDRTRVETNLRKRRNINAFG